MLAGNHDHGIAAGWIDARLQTEPSGFLGPRAALSRPREAGPLAARSRRPRRPRGSSSPTPASGCATTSTRSTATTPTCHATVPTFERLAAGRDGALRRAAARRSAPPPTTTRPCSRRSTRGCTRSTQRADHTVRQRRRRRLRARLHEARPPRSATAPAPLAALGTGYRAAVAALNAAGLGPLEATSRPQRAAPRLPARHPRGAAAASTSTRAHVIWGHSHRAGPWPQDDPAEWTAPTGARILNTGSWVYQPHFLSPRAERARPTGRAPRSRVERRRPAAARPPARRPRPRRSSGQRRA